MDSHKEGKILCGPGKSVLDVGGIKRDQGFPAGFPGFFENLAVCSNLEKEPDETESKDDKGNDDSERCGDHSSVVLLCLIVVWRAA